MIRAAPVATSCIPGILNPILGRSPSSVAVNPGLTDLTVISAATNSLLKSTVAKLTAALLMLASLSRNIY